MASVVLSIPEEQLMEFIEIARAGIAASGETHPEDTRKSLSNWCDDNEEYARLYDRRKTGNRNGN